MAPLPALTDPSLAIIFATSPTGFGHLRVTEALSKGLPPTISPVLLGAQDQVMSSVYRYISVHQATRRVMEFFQFPPFDRSVGKIGSKLLRFQTNAIYQQLQSILRERLVVPKTVLLVAPHTILGHQIGAIKDKLAKELEVTILLVVQVTDDSPQALWYVSDADLLCVPSEYTKQKLQEYGVQANLPRVPIVVSAYPISPLFAQQLSEADFLKRTEQADPDETSIIHMTIPVSGAAVGTRFSTEFIRLMHALSDRVLFHVIAREAGYTKQFLQNVTSLPYVHVHTADHDRTTVLDYEKVFEEVPVGFEITKPSEQAFKALTTTRERGGAILLFSKPVGGQEYDNLHFLRNHGLMPNKSEMTELWQLAQKQASIYGTKYLTKAHHWRALRLPDDPQEASFFVQWCLKEKLFTAMMHYVREQHAPELQSDGVAQFWNKVEILVEETIAKKEQS